MASNNDMVNDIHQPSVKTSKIVETPVATVRCKICSSDPMTMFVYQRHLSGAKHRKTIKSQEDAKKLVGVDGIVETVVDSKNVYQCKFCCIGLHSADVALAHLNGSKHKAKEHELKGISVPIVKRQAGSSFYQSVERNKKADAPKVPANAIYPNYKTSEYGGSVGSSATRKSIGYTDPAKKPPGHAVVSAPFRCDLCNCTVNSDSQLTAHQQGAKHKEKAQSVPAQQGGNEVTPLACGTSIASSLACRLCKITVNSSTQLTQHLQSSKHRLAQSGGAAYARGSTYRGRGGVARANPYQRHGSTDHGGVLTGSNATPTNVAAGAYMSGNRAGSSYSAGVTGVLPSYTSYDSSGSAPSANSYHAAMSSHSNYAATTPHSSNLVDVDYTGSYAHYNTHTVVTNNVVQPYSNNSVHYVRDVLLAKPPPPPLQASFIRGAR